MKAQHAMADDTTQQPGPKKRVTRKRTDRNGRGTGTPIRTLQETADEMLASVDASFTVPGEFGTGPSARMEPPPASAVQAPTVTMELMPAPPIEPYTHTPAQDAAPAYPYRGQVVEAQGALSDPRARIAASMQATAGARLSSWEIARAAGMPHREFLALKDDPQFVAFVSATLEEAAARANVLAVSHRAYRLQVLQADLDRLNQITSQRAAAADMRYACRDEAWLEARGVLEPAALLDQFPQVGEMWDPSNPECYMFDPDDVFVPGAATGLLVKDKKTVGAGLAAEVIDVWSLDTALLKERQSLMKQAAQEVGEWGPSGDRGDEPAMKLYIGIDMNRL